MNKNRVFAGLMAGVMVSSAVVPGFSAEASGKKEKEEVIYINLDAAGSVKDIYAVNIFGKGSVVDYGDYSSVEMLNTTDEMNRNGEEISFTTDSDRVYYKGKMNSTEIPWKISICYMLDGREYESEDLAGKSGKLQIRFQVTENKAYKGGFFDHYALQASFTLDTEKCTGIEASGATMANAGSDKQISYTILPGKGIDASITADVTDFEMSAVSINGIPLSLDVDVDDEELMDQVTDLLDAIEQIDDGTGELKDGASDLKDGIADLKDGAFGLNSGAEDVDEGAAGLKSGAEDLNKGASDLTSGIADLVSGTSALSEGAAGLKSGTSDLGKGSKALNAGILEIQNGLNQLNGQSSSLKEGSAGVYKALQQIQSALNSVSASSEEIKQLVSASAQI
nr:hypothetical protein [Lachnospiraceae bacterium]